MLGDFALGKIADTLPLVAQLSGHKVRLTGNHDRGWPGHGRRAEGWEERYLEAGFDEIVHGEVQIGVGTHQSVACHFRTAVTAVSTTASSTAARWIAATGSSTVTCTGDGCSVAG